MTAIGRTAAGLLEGNELDSGFSFLGVPYAEPPLGEFRFRPPQRRSPWEGLRPARAFGPTVPQATVVELGRLFAPVHPPGEDCLNLNVWTPELGAAGLPVLVWIHGGAFQIGSGSEPYYDGAAFARDGVVLVSINYRLGVQGFLALGEIPGSGNFGMLDQICALQWVQENISAFGGDPGNITIAGESAGGISVATLLAMPAVRGLFRRGIAQSGAAHHGIASDHAVTVTSCMAEELGLDDGGLDAWRKVPLDRLLAAEQAVASRVLARQEPRLWELAMSSLPMPFQPTVGTEALPVRPIEGIRSGIARGIDLMVGTTMEELAAILRTSPEVVGVGRGEDLAPGAVELMAAMCFAATATPPTEVVKTYRASRPRATNLELFAAMLSASAFGVPAVRLAEAQADHATVHAYRLDWKSPAAGGLWGAGHALDIPLVFDTCETGLGQFLTRGAAPRSLVDAVHGAWVAFATHGSPEHAGLPAWPSYDTIRRATMCFETPSSVLDDPNADERRIWDGVL